MHDVICRGCDLVLKLQKVDAGFKAKCPRCSTLIVTNFSHSKQQSIICGVCALFMQLLANLLPFVNLKVSNIDNSLYLFEIINYLSLANYSTIANVFLIFVEVLPVCCIVALFVFSSKLSKSIRIRAGKFFQLIKNWCMVEIFLVGLLVSFVKLMSYGSIDLYSGFWCYIMFCLLFIRALQTTISFDLWNDISPGNYTNKNLKHGISAKEQGLKICNCCRAMLNNDDSCKRCNHYNDARLNNSLQLTIALLITSFIVYIPTNFFPIMTTIGLGKTVTSNIFSGVISLYNDKAYSIAFIVFLVSIIIPSFKIITLAILCFDVKAKRDNSKITYVLYEIVEFVGKWSMVDIFVIAVLTSLVRMDNLMSVNPEPSSILFAIVVVLSMITAKTFDPRLLWDKN